jgi:protein-L-isoaspartate(D-aspartate) O-methyltransferase
MTIRQLAGGSLGLLCSLWITLAAAQDDEQRRARLVEEIREDVADTRAYTGRGELDRRVLDAIGAVPRHEFVPGGLRGSAYDNRPLPIGHGQTISQPYIVALMTDLLSVSAGDRVLEVGTGSGYQAAVLAEMGLDVFTLEIIEPLGEEARQRLAALGYDRIRAQIGDGYYGWDEHAPFDAIIVTAAAGQIPPPLVRQLKPGGTMVIPVGARFQVQQLTLVEKAQDGEVTTRQVLPVRFVPLTGRH